MPLQPLLSRPSRRIATELAVVFFAFVALDLLRIVQALPRDLFGDEWRYLYYADNLLHGFYSPRERVFLWNGPGYPLLILPFVRAGWVDGARYANAFWHAGMLAYAWALLRPYARSLWSLIALLPLYFYRPLNDHLPLLYTEVVCCFLLTGWAYHAAQRQRGIWHPLIAGVYLGVLCLTKVIFGVALIAFCMILGGLWLYRRSGTLAAQLKIALLALALCTPYLSYTYQLTGRWLYWSSAAGNNFYWLTSPYRDESGDWYHQGWVRNNAVLRAHHKPIFDQTSGVSEHPDLADQEQLFNLSTPESADVFVRAGLDNVRKRPVKFLRNYLANLSRLFFDVPTSVRGTPLWNPASVWNGPLLLWSALVVLLATRRRVRLPRVYWPSLGFAWLALSAYTLSSLSARFLIPFVPLWWPISCAWFGAARGPGLSRHVVLRWRALPNVVERWSICNAVAALAAAAVSLAVHDLRPALVATLGSLAYVYFAAAPSGVSLASAITAGRTGIQCAALAFAPEHGSWISAATLTNFSLDGVDGWVARKLGQTSDFGARFDMESDSHTVLLLDLWLVIHAGYPLWVLCAGVLRYAFVLCRFGVGPRVLRERRSSFSRWVFSLVLVSRAFACLPDVRVFALPLLALATLAVCISFAPDFYALRPER